MYTFNMEPNIQIPKPVAPITSNSPPIENKKTKFQKITNYFFNNITIISISVFILLSLSVVIFFYYQNQSLKKMLSVYTEPSPTPIVSNDPLANWEKYINNNDNYEFKVPREWNKTTESTDSGHLVVFQSADGLYRFTVDAQENKNKVTGNTYPSLDEFIGLPYVVKSLKVDELEARQPLPKSGSENYNKIYFFSKDKQTIFSLELLVGDGTKTDHRVTFEALEIGSDIFDKIISTFKFKLDTKPTSTPITETQGSSPSATACTMEAKICPDGSSVGRVPPNCEFAPCPTSKPITQ